MAGHVGSPIRASSPNITAVISFLMNPSLLSNKVIIVRYVRDCNSDLVVDIQIEQL